VAAADIPLKVRDKILSKYQRVETIDAPKSEIGLAHFAMQASKKQEENEASKRLGFISPAAHAELMSIARMEPSYERNLPKLCGHFLKGTCTRGASCPFRHEFPDDWDTNKAYYLKSAHRSIKDRFFGTNDTTSDRWIAKLESREVDAAGGGGEVSTLLLTGVGSSLRSADVREAFESYGDLKRVDVLTNKGIAFVEFATKDQAVECMMATRGRVVINGSRIRLAWARPSAPASGGLLGEVSASASASEDVTYPSMAPQAYGGSVKPSS
jgi:pre-mRNA-splicing factor RBM22/SLT11